MENINNRRIFFLAVNTGYTIDGVPERRFLDFYAERSGRGLHCAIIGNVAIPNGFGTNASTPLIDNNKIWKEIAEAISIRDTLPGIQLSTTWQSYVGARTFLAKTPIDQLNFYKHIASQFDKQHITSQYSSLKSATSFAIDSGFKHVQLHAAHGYFFNLILDNRFSKHHELAVDLTHDWIESTRREGIETSIRISTLTGANDFDLEQSSFLEKILSIPFDYHDISEGFYNINKKLIYPSIQKILIDRLNRSIELALSFPENNFIASGKSYPLTKVDLPDNIHIGICRDLIANPNFLAERDNGCKNKMKCHYYSRGQKSMTCGQWVKAK